MTVFYTQPPGRFGLGVADASVRLDGDVADEQLRIETVAENRHYYNGTQYDADNAAWCAENNLATWEDMPEADRKHNYATQIAECVDFIANQLTDGAQILPADPRAKQVVDAAVDASPLLQNASDEDIAFDTLMIDGAQGGDVPYETVWDPSTNRATWEFWPAEQVEFDVPRGNRVLKVTRTQKVTEVSTVDGSEIRTSFVEKAVYTIDDHDGRPECVKRTYRDADTNPEEEVWLGLPFIPWDILVVYKEGIRGFRGDPLITRKAKDNADRYNANEQQAFLIGQHNSHGNLAVVGDQSFLQLERDPTVNKGPTDVLTFPGGTAVYPILLPTDPQMIEHTRQVCSDAIYSSFGLTRVEPDTLDGIGGISGYALEILNRKSEGKLRRVRRQFKTSVIRMVNHALDVWAYRGNNVLPDDTTDEFDPENLDDQPEVAGWWDIDPMAVFPNRDVEIRMGTGYIVDDVGIRDDYTAGLTSWAEALRLRGYSDADIARMRREKLTEIEDGFAVNLNPPQPKVVKQTVTAADQTVQQAQQNQPGNPDAQPSGTQAGKTTGSTIRK